MHITRLYRKSMHLTFQPIHFRKHAEWEKLGKEKKNFPKNEIERLPKLKSQVCVSVLLRYR